MNADVIIVGGGPGGSICAARLARGGARVIVLERETFPRFRLGESLLPGSMPIFREIGVLDSLLSTFIHKHGARFHDDEVNKKERFAFGGAWDPEYGHAFQVPRDAFDALLLEHARTCGADVRHGWRVVKVTETGVEAVSPEGSSSVLTAGLVVDATGREALTSGGAAAMEKIPSLDQTALFSHFEGIPREAGEREGDIDIVLFGDAGDSEKRGRGWFWVIPFKDGRTSVGAVVSRGWMRANRAEGADVRRLFDLAVGGSSTMREMLAPARMVWDSPRATADFSYRRKDILGNGWIAVGDAAGFIDPLFSTGVHLAVTGGKTAADVILETLGGSTGALAGRSGSIDAREVPELREWETRLRRGAETFTYAVRAFYKGPLVDYLFADNKHTALRRSITSLLAGDVFEDPIWLRDSRRRLKDMVDS